VSTRLRPRLIRIRRQRRLEKIPAHVLLIENTHHVTNNIKILTNIHKLTKPIYMKCANDSALEVKFIGEAQMINPHTGDYIKLIQVRYAKACPANLLSEKKLCSKIIFITLGDEKHLIEKSTGKLLHVAKQDGRFWIARMLPINQNRKEKAHQKAPENKS